MEMGKQATHVVVLNSDSQRRLANVVDVSGGKLATYDTAWRGEATLLGVGQQHPSEAQYRMPE